VAYFKGLFRTIRYWERLEETIGLPLGKGEVGSSILPGSTIKTHSIICEAFAPVCAIYLRAPLSAKIVVDDYAKN